MTNNEAKALAIAIHKALETQSDPAKRAIVLGVKDEIADMIENEAGFNKWRVFNSAWDAAWQADIARILERS